MSSLAVARRVDVTAVVLGLVAVTGLAWVVTVRLAAGMAMPGGSMEMATAMPPTDGGGLVVLAMWAAMMVGMMVPSATPMVLAYTGWTRRGAAGARRAAAVASFLSGYVVVWLAFSVLAAAIQVLLERLGLLTAS